MSSDNGPKIWPPPPGNGYQSEELSQNDTWRLCLSYSGQKLTLEASYKHRSFQMAFVWFMPLVWGIGGAAVGAGVLLLMTLLLSFYGHSADLAGDFKFALFLAALIGIVGGFIVGFGCWLIGRIVVGLRGPERLDNEISEP